MTVRWKPRGQAKFFAMVYPAILLLLGVAQALMGKPMWGTLVIAGLMTLPMIWVMGILSLPREIGFEGRWLTIERDRWNLEDVDSVSIGQESVRMNLYRPGKAGTEFTATSKEMDEETWRQVRECCGRIEDARKLG